MGEAERDKKEQIEKKAFEIYESRGREGGHEVEDWAEAERQVAETGTPEESTPRQFSSETGQQYRRAGSPEESSETLDEELGYTQGQAE
jgi:Protein of unknown function (DUF2934)